MGPDEWPNNFFDSGGTRILVASAGTVTAECDRCYLATMQIPPAHSAQKRNS